MFLSCCGRDIWPASTVVACSLRLVVTLSYYEFLANGGLKALHGVFVLNEVGMKALHEVFGLKALGNWLMCGEIFSNTILIQQ